VNQTTYQQSQLIVSEDRIRQMQTNFPIKKSAKQAKVDWIFRSWANCMQMSKQEVYLSGGGDALPQTEIANQVDDQQAKCHVPFDAAQIVNTRTLVQLQQAAPDQIAKGKNMKRADLCIYSSHDEQSALVCGIFMNFPLKGVPIINAIWQQFQF
jgi:hypothetical protein